MMRPEFLSTDKGTGTIRVGHPDRPLAAVGLLVGGLFLLALQDAVVKLAADAVSLWQFQFVRALMSAAMILALGQVFSWLRPRWPIRPGMVALRSALVALSMLLFFAGVPFLTLSQIAAGLYAFPLVIVLLAAVLPGERVGWRRLLAVAVGFAGTLMALRPDATGAGAVAFLPVGAAFAYAAMVLVTRRSCREEHPATMIFGVALAFIITGGAGLAIVSLVEPPAGLWPYLATGWRPLEGWVVAGMAVCAALTLAANYALTVAYQRAESSWLAPFDYVYHAFAAVVGGLVFGDWPDATAIVGLLLISGAGLVVAERRRRVAA